MFHLTNISQHPDDRVWLRSAWLELQGHFTAAALIAVMSPLKCRPHN